MTLKDVLLPSKKTISWLIAGGGGIIGSYLFYYEKRKKRHESIQKRVNDSAPQSPKMIPKVNKSIDTPPIRLNVVVQKEEVDLTCYEKIDLNPQEANEWKALLSTYGGKIIENQLTTSTFTGLVKCDIPLNELCRVANNSEAKRGYVFQNGKIIQHASFSKPSVSKAMPPLIYQCLAAVTSQYYQQIITERLDRVDEKLEDIIRIMKAEDESKLSTAYQRLIELFQKDCYDTSDKFEASDFSNDIETIRRKYGDELHSALEKIEKVGPKWTNEKESKQKIQLLENMHYFESFEIALYADAIEFISNLVLIKIARYLDNKEDENRYSSRIDFDFWSHYVDGFNKVKHNMLKYLELQLQDAWIGKEDILGKKNELMNKFKKAEEKAKHFHELFNCNTTWYMQVPEEGMPKLYVACAPSPTLLE